jgi:hypothetical protein
MLFPINVGFLDYVLRLAVTVMLISDYFMSLDGRTLGCQVGISNVCKTSSLKNLSGSQDSPVV